MERCILDATQMSGCAPTLPGDVDSKAAVLRSHHCMIDSPPLAQPECESSPSIRVPAARPLVSVIVPVYNGRRYVKEAIQSALDQTYAPCEIFVIDDGSDEPVEPFLAEFGQAIHVFRTTNRGVAAARNRGIQESTGDLIALLDQDDVWLPTKLERQVDLLLRDDQIGLVHCDIVYRDETQGRDYVKRRPRADLAGRCYGRLFLGCAISACTVVFRRSVLDYVGFFDEHIRGTDDYDLELRIARQYSFGYVDERLAIYRVHDRNWSHRSLDMLRNELLVVQKAVAQDQELYGLLGVEAVTERLARLLSAIGYAYFDAGAYQEARPYLAKALSNRSDFLTALRWTSTLLPPPVVGVLRWVKQSWSSI